jgi:hypothetical protein
MAVLIVAAMANFNCKAQEAESPQETVSMLREQAQWLLDGLKEDATYWEPAPNGLTPIVQLAYKFSSLGFSYLSGQLFDLDNKLYRLNLELGKLPTNQKYLNQLLAEEQIVISSLHSALSRLVNLYP